jgi:hypothetical protein
MPAPIRHATVTYRGDPTVRVLLERADGARLIPGEVPPGSYTVWATFGGDAEPTQVLTLDLHAGESASLVCRESLRRCGHGPGP